MAFVRINKCRASVKIVLATCVTVSVIVLVTVEMLVRENMMFGMKHTINRLMLRLDELGQGTTNTTTDVQSKSGNKIIENIMRNSNSSAPLYDFVAFPCTDQLPPFPEVDHVDKGVCVRTINGSNHVDNVASTDCVSLKTPGGTTPICIHAVAADIHVSRSLKTSGGWEYNLVNSMCKKLLAYPAMEFLDLGCNIGVYSLSVARTGRRAVCVDPFIRNLELVSRSLTLGNLRENVILIWNAVSNDYREVGFLMDNRNIGGTAIQDVTGGKSSGPNYRVRTIRLDDLTPLFKGKQLGIKMDVERHELNVLEGGAAFFDQVDVRFIQMEIMFHKTTATGVRIAEYLAGHDFMPYKDIHGSVKLDRNQIRRWPNDVYFIKRLSSK